MIEGADRAELKNIYMGTYSGNLAGIQAPTQSIAGIYFFSILRFSGSKKIRNLEIYSGFPKAVVLHLR